MSAAFGAAWLRKEREHLALIIRAKMKGPAQVERPHVSHHPGLVWKFLLARLLEQIAPALAFPCLSMALIEIDDPIRIICHGRHMVYTCASRRIDR